MIEVQRLLFQTSVINNRWDESIRMKLKQNGYIGIVPNHGPILKVISLDDSGMTVTELAETLVRPKPTITESLNKLEKMGYITRIKYSEDKRVTYIKLTKLGSELNKFLIQEVTCFLEDMLKDMDRSEKKMLVDLLEKCI